MHSADTSIESRTRTSERSQSAPSEETYRILRLEAALEAHYVLRVVCSDESDEPEERLLRPVRLLRSHRSGAAPAHSTLVARDALDGHEVALALSRLRSVSIDTRQLPVDRIIQDGFGIGDAVQHASLGFGVVQAVKGSTTGSLGKIRFATGETKTFVLRRAHLTLLEQGNRG